MKTSIKIIALLVLGLSACKATQDSVSNPKTNAESHSNNKASAIYWQQNSAEYAALCYQAFNVAGYQLKGLAAGIDPMTGESTIQGDASKPMAIVMDLDETVIDNSLYSGYLIQNNLVDDPNLWNDWVKRASADLIPGAKEFIDKANQVNIPIYFISNRTEQNLSLTFQTLAEKGIAFDPNNLLVKRVNESKSERRRSLISSFNVVMLIGDNLADFHEIFETDLKLEQRKELLERFKSELGHKFIILPNLLYGDWELKEASEKDPNLMVPVKDLTPYIKSYK